MGYFSELDLERNEMENISNEPKINYTTKNVDINGTSLQGYINANYFDLVTLFGEPCDGDGYKVDAEWDIEFDDGTIATIYNYKNGHNYCGGNGMPVGSMTDWNVGGFTQDAVHKVLDVIKQYSNSL
jgi:hypothetical protein